MATRKAGTAAAPATALELKAAAVRRVRAREIRGGGFLPPRSLDEWLDDRAARVPVGTAATDTLAAILDAARGGLDAARAAVAAAGQLGLLEQWTLWLTLTSLPRAAPGVPELLAGVTQEWLRLGLASSKPGSPYHGPLAAAPGAD